MQPYCSKDGATSSLAGNQNCQTAARQEAAKGSRLSALSCVWVFNVRVFSNHQSHKWHFATIEVQMIACVCVTGTVLNLLFVSTGASASRDSSVKVGGWSTLPHTHTKEGTSNFTHSRGSAMLAARSPDFAP